MSHGSKAVLQALLLLLLAIDLDLIKNRAAAEQKPDSLTEESKTDEEPKLQIDPAAVRDAIASMLREGSGAGAPSGQHQSDEDDGYSEAAREYLEHVQSVLAGVKSPSEVYLRDQLADLDGLDLLLTRLEAASADCRPLALPGTSARLLVSHLVKGPARELLLPILQEASVYTGSQLASRVAGAAGDLRRFLAIVTANMTEDLRRFSDGLPAGPSRDYLDSVLDRVLELEGRPTRFDVEFPAEGAEPKISRVAEEEEQQSSSSAGSSDAGGRALFDQVIARRAAASVAARIAEADEAAAAAVARIAELRGRRYQPAGMKVLLDAIEQCLKIGGHV